MWIPGGIYRWATQFLPSSHGTSYWREVESGYMLGLRLRCVFAVWNNPETIYYIFGSVFFFFNVYLNKSYTNLTQAWELIDQRPLNAAENRWGHTAVGRGTLFGLGHCWMLQATTPLAANFFLKGMSRIGEFSWHKMEDFVGHVWWLDVIGG